VICSHVQARYGIRALFESRYRRGAAACRRQRPAAARAVLGRASCRAESCVLVASICMRHAVKRIVTAPVSSMPAMFLLRLSLVRWCYRILLRENIC